MFELVLGNSGGNEKLVFLRGEIDIYSAPDFRENLFQAIGDCKEDIVLDCSELSYIDSMGLGIMVAALKRAKQNDSNVRIRNPKPNVKKLFKITGLDKVFIMEDSK
ncbi:MAG TPA: STAS domain-containing protein [Thermoclostridium caenicola]|uniref:Anti-sigma factor antagonist n=1 Tax=Thermoclostridium caenicola TaxID=659425 RepID=A0A1M6BSQ9_9FIRM|nr:STAS domain-containing protein [Thermoclostridium caenicola]SHI51518.1 anti-sigma B factor antagonist [Thermoclostridium caenicola]HOK43745.1 STAS domain-containing protein [Thermoclostridium caenicola]HOL84214.1 STAS domain-containing protein [Thermoclostridium caenicola]HOP71790.1 STAS domain-containing protein [Thermoclostridium caenicola]HPO75773.1 STAS domain-containing protein [Thermoclostridium caenicola]